MEHGLNDEQVNAAIRRLWSFDNAERKLGKKDLIELGPKAIDPLISLLSDLAHDQYSRFALGKEQEGQLALQEYITAARNYSENPSEYYDKIRPFIDRLSAVAINTRLMTDAVRLLGELKAEKAVPILIEIVLNRPFHGAEVGGFESDALCCIGEPAVPELIKYLDETNIKAGGFDWIDYGFSFEIGPKDDETEGREDFDQDGDDEENFDFKEYEKDMISRVRQRIVWILGEIGGLQSLPALESLLNTTEDKSLIYRITEARDKIRGEGRNDSNLPGPRILPRCRLSLDE